MKIDKTMTPKKAPPCKVCKGLKKIKAHVHGVETEKMCPACGGTGQGKLMTK